jgi:hypothetical protein
LSHDEKLEVLNTGIGCEEFESSNPPQAVIDYKNPVSDVVSKVIKFKDGTMKNIESGKETKPKTPKTSTSTETQYTYDKSGILAWAKDNNLSTNVADYDFTKTEGGYYKSNNDWIKLFYVDANGEQTPGTEGEKTGTWSKTTI